MLAYNPDQRITKLAAACLQTYMKNCSNAPLTVIERFDVLFFSIFAGSFMNAQFSMLLDGRISVNCFLFGFVI